MTCNLCKITRRGRVYFRYDSMVCKCLSSFLGSKAFGNCEIGRGIHKMRKSLKKRKAMAENWPYNAFEVEVQLPTM